MWTCPKCGRSFKNQNQDHYCKKAPETIDEYITSQPEEAQPYLNQVREAIRAALPKPRSAFPGVCPPTGKAATSSTLQALKSTSACTRDRRLS